eukprot:scpid27762/ scgid9219/ 
MAMVAQCQSATSGAAPDMSQCAGYNVSVFEVSLTYTGAVEQCRQHGMRLIRIKPFNIMNGTNCFRKIKNRLVTAGKPSVWFRNPGKEYAILNLVTESRQVIAMSSNETTDGFICVVEVDECQDLDICPGGQYCENTVGGGYRCNRGSPNFPAGYDSSGVVINYSTGSFRCGKGFYTACSKPPCAGGAADTPARARRDGSTLTWSNLPTCGLSSIRCGTSTYPTGSVASAAIARQRCRGANSTLMSALYLRALSAQDRGCVLNRASPVWLSDSSGVDRVFDPSANVQDFISPKGGDHGFVCLPTDYKQLVATLAPSVSTAGANLACRVGSEVLACNASVIVGRRQFELCLPSCGSQPTYHINPSTVTCGGLFMSINVRPITHKSAVQECTRHNASILRLVDYQLLNGTRCMVNALTSLRPAGVSRLWIKSNALNVVTGDVQKGFSKTLSRANGFICSTAAPAGPPGFPSGYDSSSIVIDSTTGNVRCADGHYSHCRSPPCAGGAGNIPAKSRAEGGKLIWYNLPTCRPYTVQCGASAYLTGRLVSETAAAKRCRDAGTAMLSALYLGTLSPQDRGCVLDRPSPVWIMNARGRNSVFDPSDGAQDFMDAKGGDYDFVCLPVDYKQIMGSSLPGVKMAGSTPQCPARSQMTMCNASVAMHGKQFQMCLPTCGQRQPMKYNSSILICNGLNMSINLLPTTYQAALHECKRLGADMLSERDHRMLSGTRCLKDALASLNSSGMARLWMKQRVLHTATGEAGNVISRAMSRADGFICSKGVAVDVPVGYDRSSIVINSTTKHVRCADGYHAHCTERRCAGVDTPARYQMVGEKLVWRNLPTCRLSTLQCENSTYLTGSVASFTTARQRCRDDGTVLMSVLYLGVLSPQERGCVLDQPQPVWLSDSKGNDEVYNPSAGVRNFIHAEAKKYGFVCLPADYKLTMDSAEADFKIDGETHKCRGKKSEISMCDASVVIRDQQFDLCLPTCGEKQPMEYNATTVLCNGFNVVFHTQQVSYWPASRECRQQNFRILQHGEYRKLKGTECFKTAISSVRSSGVVTLLTRRAVLDIVKDTAQKDFSKGMFRADGFICARELPTITPPTSFPDQGHLEFGAAANSGGLSSVSSGLIGAAIGCGLLILLVGGFTYYKSAKKRRGSAAFPQPMKITTKDFFMKRGPAPMSPMSNTSTVNFAHSDCDNSRITREYPERSSVQL